MSTQRHVHAHTPPPPPPALYGGIYRIKSVHGVRVGIYRGGKYPALLIGTGQKSNRVSVLPAGATTGVLLAPAGLPRKLARPLRDHTGFRREPDELHRSGRVGRIDGPRRKASLGLIDAVLENYSEENSRIPLLSSVEFALFLNVLKIDTVVS
ncbi:hypothetical protein KM043_014139 [Ampulex compressa]|nr:hypothetical protein KM043_014139 [Ampulex compressa]